MLISIREKTQGIVAGFIVVIIILVFALWGVNSYFAGDSEVLVAEGSNIKISQRVYRNTYRNIVEQQRGRIPQTILDSPFYKQQIVERLIQDTLLSQYVDEAGYRISDKKLSERIRQQAYFQKANSFDPELYKLALRAQQLSPAQYETQLRGNLMAAQLSSGYTASTFAIENEVNQLLMLMLQERDIDYIEIKPEAFRNNIRIDKKRIQEFYDKNKSSYQTPEKIKIEYVILSAKELAKEYKPTTAELKEAFESRSEFVTPARRWASHILVEAPKGASKKEEAAALEKIEKLAQEIKNGKRFSDAAKKYSDDKGSAIKGGDLGEIKPGVMVKKFEKVLNNMTRRGAVSKPVRTQYGYHLIKLTKYIAEQRKSFNAVKAQLEKIVRKQVGEKKYFDASPDFYNIVYERPDSLQPVADALGLKVKQSAWFSRNGGNGITAKKEIVAAAFHPDVIEAGRNSEAIEIDETTLVAVRLLEHKKKEQKPLADVEKIIKNTLRDKLALKKVKELKQKVLDELKKTNLRTVAGKYKLKLLTSSHIIRSKTEGVDRRIIDRVFTTRIPKKDTPIVGDVNLGTQGAAVFVLKAVRPGIAEKADLEMRTRARDLLKKRHGDGYFQAFMGNLRETTKIKVFKENL